MAELELDLMLIPDSLEWIGKVLGLGHRICNKTLDRMREEGLPVHQICSRLFISQRDFVAWVETRKGTPPVVSQTRRGRPAKSQSAKLSRLRRIVNR